MSTDVTVANKSRPTGRRRTTAAQMQATAHLTGALPALQRFQVLAAFKKAAPILGFSPAVVHTMDLLFAYSRDIDWQDGWPRLVWPSQERLTSATGLTVGGIKARIRRLIDLGLIRTHDIGTGRRWGKRDKKTGRILQACGFDLSPLGERLTELLTASTELEARRVEATALRGECSASLRVILSLIDLALEQALLGADWLALAEEARQFAAASRMHRDALQLAPLAGRLRLLQDKVESLVKAAQVSVKYVNNDPQGSLSSPPNTTTNKLKNANAFAPAGNSLAQEESRAKGKSGDASFNGVRHESAEETALFRGFPVTPQVLLHLVPVYRDWVTDSAPSWGEISDACNLVRQNIGISTHLYAQTRLVLGEKGTSVAIGIIAVKHQAKLVRNPHGYLRCMLEKQHIGELRLDKTLHGLADAAGRSRETKQRG